MNYNISVLADKIYEWLCYMYCDNCRYKSEIEDESACEDCHRKYNGWAVSYATATRISKEALESLQKGDE